MAVVKMELIAEHNRPAIQVETALSTSSALIDTGSSRISNPSFSATKKQAGMSEKWAFPPFLFLKVFIPSRGLMMWMKLNIGRQLLLMIIASLFSLCMLPARIKIIRSLLRHNRPL